MNLSAMNSPDGPILRVFIVDDHQLFRAGVRHEIAGRAGAAGESRSWGRPAT